MSNILTMQRCTATAYSILTCFIHSFHLFSVTVSSSSWSLWFNSFFCCCLNIHIYIYYILCIRKYIGQVETEIRAGASGLGQGCLSEWTGLVSSFGSVQKSVCVIPCDETASHCEDIPVVYSNKPLSEEFINE